MTTAINLLPWRSRLRFKRIFYFKIQLLVFVGVATLILLVWHLNVQQKINNTIKQYHSLQLQQKQVVKQVQDDERLQQQQQGWQHAANSMARLEQQRLKFVQLFFLMHQALSNNVYLDQLVINSLKIKVSGCVISIADLRQFIARFTAEQGGVVPVIQKINKQGNSYSFVITIQI